MKRKSMLQQLRALLVLFSESMHSADFARLLEQSRNKLGHFFAVISRSSSGDAVMARLTISG
jgi:hypothetical protein